MSGSASTVQVLRQHLIDPEICIRCNTCEETCPSHAISHDSRNYVVDAAKCNFCNDCISPCPTGAIDSWRQVDKAKPYTLAEQLAWDSLPAQTEVDAGAAAEMPTEVARITSVATAGQGGEAFPPWSAAHPYVNLYSLQKPAIATVSGNFRLTADDASSDIRHIVLDFGGTAFPVLEGQTIGILPPGVDASGKPHHVRLYSIASPRDGERPRYNNLSLTVKRVTEDHDGKPVVGVASNYLCDLKKGDQVQRRRTLRHDLPDAEPSRFEPADGLHGHRLGADARDDRAAAAPHRAQGGRRAHAVLRCAIGGRAPLFRPADEAAERFHRHQLRVLARTRRAEAIRAGPDPRAQRGCCAPARR